MTHMLRVIGVKKKTDRKSTKVQLRVQDSPPTLAAEMYTEELSPRRTAGALLAREFLQGGVPLHRWDS